jgi:hypothetical protein
VSGDELRSPPWVEPGENVLPAAVELIASLGRRADGAEAWLTGVSATPDGVRFTLVVARPEQDPPVRGNPFTGEDGLRVGVRFADGREASASDRSWREPEPAGGIALVWLGSGGWARRWEQQGWLWPLPPEGPVTFTSSWGEDVVVDAAPLRAAAARAVELWPDERPFWPVPDEHEDGADDESGWLDYAPITAGGARTGPAMAPGAVGAAPVLLRTESAAAWLGDLAATPDGLDLTVNVVWRERFEADSGEGPFGDGLPFTLRVVLPDGADAPLLLSGGDGWNSGMRRRAWLAPLPPEGDAALRRLLAAGGRRGGGRRAGRRAAAHGGAARGRALDRGGASLAELGAVAAVHEAGGDVALGALVEVRVVGAVGARERAADDVHDATGHCGSLGIGGEGPSSPVLRGRATRT